MISRVIELFDAYGFKRLADELRVKGTLINDEVKQTEGGD